MRLVSIDLLLELIVLVRWVQHIFPSSSCRPYCTNPCWIDTLAESISKLWDTSYDCFANFLKFRCRRVAAIDDSSVVSEFWWMRI